MKSLRCDADLPCTKLMSKFECEEAFLMLALIFYVDLNPTVTGRGLLTSTTLNMTRIVRNIRRVV